jgi:mRNA interferase RelE/StbE
MVASYAVEFRPEARDGLRRLSKPNAQRVLDKIKWLAQHGDATTHTRLTGEFSGLCKLRVGDYRVIYSVDPQQQLISVHLVGHRRSVYERR